MRETHTDIVVILDRSGSMNAMWTDTIGGLNRFIEEQRVLPGTADLSIHVFDDVFETVVDAHDIKSVSPTVLDGVFPRNGTALYDAVVRGVGMANERIAKLPEEERPANRIFVVVSDGGENKSTEVRSGSVVRSTVKRAEEGGCKFLFFGTNIDAFTVGGDLGMKGVAYSNSGQGMQGAMRSASAYVGSSRLRSAGIQNNIDAAVFSSRSVEDDEAKTGAELFREIADAYGKGVSSAEIAEIADMLKKPVVAKE